MRRFHRPSVLLALAALGCGASETPIAEAGEGCGGFTHGPAPVCATGLYCSYALEDRCGWADAAGVCEERPASCTEEHMPVCGCDGRTYANPCLAAMAGVAVQAMGECDGAPTGG